MTSTAPFDLPEFMFSQFNRVDFGGNLFGQWPVGIRFEIGIKQVDRAVQLFNFLFGGLRDCILVSQDWKVEGYPPEQSPPLFKAPGIFHTQPTQFQNVDVSSFDEAEYRLTWTRISLEVLDAARMLQAIANREQDGVPKISSGVYIIDPGPKIIMHMYDDRGLDVIATEIDTLRPLFDLYQTWVLENQRNKVELRFKTPTE